MYALEQPLPPSLPGGGVPCCDLARVKPKPVVLVGAHFGKAPRRRGHRVEHEALVLHIQVALQRDLGPLCARRLDLGEEVGVLARVHLQDQRLLFGKLGDKRREGVAGQPALAAPLLNAAVVADHQEQLLGVAPADLEHGLHLLELGVSFPHVLNHGCAPGVPRKLRVEVAVLLVNVNGVVQAAAARRLQEARQGEQALGRPAAHGEAIVSSAFVPLDCELVRIGVVSLRAGNGGQEHGANVHVASGPTDVSGGLATGHGAQAVRVDGLLRADGPEFLGFGALLLGHGCWRRSGC